MRHVAVDFGQRRIGLAISDATGLLARPWRTLAADRTPRASAAAVAALLAAGDDDEASGVGALVIGLPRRLNGDDTDQTAAARAFGRAVGELTGLPVHFQDERLTSYEADARLAQRERDWRKRKARLDAAAAAIILQDYLDGQVRPARSGEPADGGPDR